MRNKVIAILLLAAAPLMAADKPATQPHDPPHRGPGDHRPDRDFSKLQGNFTPEEYDKAAKFFQQTSPIRTADLQQKKLWDSPAMKHLIVNRWRNLEWLNKEDHELYQNKLQQMTEEDRAFGIVNTMPKGEPKDEVRTELKDHIRELVDLSIAERKIKIEKIKQTLQAEQKRLDVETERLQKDQENRDQTVATFLEKTLTDRNLDWLRGISGPRRPGGHEWPSTAPAPTSAIGAP